MSTAPHSLPLPAKPNLEKLKKDAKHLLRAFRAGDPAALATVDTFHPLPRTFTGLRDAQLVIARRYGCQDWEALGNMEELRRLSDETIAQQAEQFILNGCLRYSEDWPWRYARATSMLEQTPAIARDSIYAALVAGDLAAVRNFLDQDPALAQQSGGPLNWWPLLYLTYSRVHTDKQQVLAILQLLLTHGADPDCFMVPDGYNHFTAITGAMGEGERGPVNCPEHPHADELVAALLTAGASANQCQGLYNTMFTGSIDKWLRLFISHGLSADYKLSWDKEQKKTTFDFFVAQAAETGPLERVKLLVELGADVNARSQYNGRTIHTNAVLSGHQDIASYLAAKGARVETLAPADQLRQACFNDDKPHALALLAQYPALKQDARILRDLVHAGLAMVLWLVEQGFDINGRTSDGRTLLHHYGWLNNVEAVKILVEKGAQPNLADNVYRATPLGFAIYNHAWDVVAFLQPLAENIFDAVCLSDVKRAKFLLDRDSSIIKLRTPMGNTPLHVMGSARPDEIDVEASAHMLALLLTCGADRNALNNEGLTPRDFYQKLGMQELVELLQ